MQSRVKLLRSWYISETHRPINLSKKCFEKYGCDIVFIGHYEDDGRLECLEKIVLQGWKLRIFGPGYEWNRVLKKSNVLKDIAPVDLVWEDEYNLALNGAKIALCFFLKLIMIHIQGVVLRFQLVKQRLCQNFQVTLQVCMLKIKRRFFS